MENVICEDLIYLDTNIETQEELFHFIATKIVAKNRADYVDQIIEGFYKREKEFSTAMNDQIAIPHCRVETIHEASVMIIRNTKTIKWSDQEEVNLFFVLLIPEANENQMHIRILAQVAQLIMEDEFIEKVRHCQDPLCIYEEMSILNEVLYKEE